MIEFLIYNGKVAVLLAVFYLFYRLLMERETFHRLNRAVLLLSVLASSDSQNDGSTGRGS